MTRLKRHSATRRTPGPGFFKDRSGVSAVEFALLLPIMVLLFLGGVELSDALTVQRKVTHVTSSLSDLVTQSKTISKKDMNNILDAAASIIAPYSESRLKIKVSGVAIDDKGKATVSWSEALNDTPLAKNSSITLPAAVTQPSTFIITAEVHYDYQPTIGYVLTGAIDLADKFYLRPRLGGEVEWTG